ncbi:MAG: hypothetical protein ACK5QN_07685 [Burkholderiales bacterium]|jgi:hypothetical protein
MSYPSRCMGVGMAAALTEQVCGDIQDNVTAAGSTQGTATLVTGAHVIVTTAAASTGVILPPAEPGAEVTVKNLGANAVNIYPATGGAINALSANAAFSVAAGGQARLLGRNSLNWVTY